MLVTIGFKKLSKLSLTPFEITLSLLVRSQIQSGCPFERKDAAFSVVTKKPLISNVPSPLFFFFYLFSFIYLPVWLRVGSKKTKFGLYLGVRTCETHG